MNTLEVVKAVSDFLELPVGVKYHGQNSVEIKAFKVKPVRIKAIIDKLKMEGKIIGFGATQYDDFVLIRKW